MIVKVIDKNYKDLLDQIFQLDSMFYRVNCLGTISIWYRLRKEGEIGCYCFGPSQIELYE